MNSMTTEMSDVDLLRRYVSQNDTFALETLFARHADMAYRTALRVTRNAADAEDAVQTAFVSALRNAHKYRGGEGVGVWIAKCAMNAAKNLIQSAVRRRAREETAVKEAETLVAENTAGKNDLAMRIRRLLDALPEKYRMSVWLHHGEGMPFADVGRALSVPEVTARSHASRGLAMLREKLALAGMPVPVASVAAVFGSMSGESAPSTLTRRIGPLVESGGRAGLSPGARLLVARMRLSVAWMRLAVAAAAVAAVAGTASIVVLRRGGEPAPPAEERRWPSRYVPGPILFEKDFSEGLAGWSILEAPKVQNGQVEWQFVPANETVSRGARILNVEKDGETIPVLEITVPQDSENRVGLQLEKDIEALAFSIEWTVRPKGSESAAAMTIPVSRKYRFVRKGKDFKSSPRGWVDKSGAWYAEFVPLPDSDPPGGMRITQYSDDGMPTLEVDAWMEIKRAKLNVVRGRLQVVRVTVREWVPVWD